ncbi:iron chelate uptake ABC transporter family permease subunit [Blastococcus brunescens]|uniref:Iron chelate uptake ABC transporter family permease subunit n=1 Tax=Blastococcus brunescens TaxID=1564165 RepID=A0ABZ1AUA3_9ACTN|nr:iron chelate uptake ABC transporter family permease subunit [Blastococcus sp. BMG 8361]WRL62024.1 iron chelate uptake ABC transporter family permease subunit [Blastococcus sp. BMG 8361]
MVVGAALGLSGAVMQGVTRNPLADPGVLGINMGASLAVVVGFAWFGLFSATSIVWTAIAGAALAAVFVYAVGSLGRGGPTPLKLALAGTATSAALISFLTAVALPAATSPRASSRGRSVVSAAPASAGSGRWCRSWRWGSPSACCRPGR